jgi:hypothetical protein
MLLATGVVLAVIASTAPLPRTFSAQPLVDGVRALLNADLYPGGGVLSCALRR